MSDDIFYGSHQLTQAMKKAVRSLVTHENVATAAFRFLLDEKMMVRIGANAMLADRDRR